MNPLSKHLSCTKILLHFTEISFQFPMKIKPLPKLNYRGNYRNVFGYWCNFFEMLGFIETDHKSTSDYFRWSCVIILMHRYFDNFLHSHITITICVPSNYLLFLKTETNLVLLSSVFHVFRDLRFHFRPNLHFDF